MVTSVCIQLVRARRRNRRLCTRTGWRSEWAELQPSGHRFLSLSPFTLFPSVRDWGENRRRTSAGADHRAPPPPPETRSPPPHTHTLAHKHTQTLTRARAPVPPPPPPPPPRPRWWCRRDGETVREHLGALVERSVAAPGRRGGQIPPAHTGEARRR